LAVCERKFSYNKVYGSLIGIEAIGLRLHNQFVYSTSNGARVVHNCTGEFYSADVLASARANGVVIHL